MNLEYLIYEAKNENLIIKNTDEASGCVRTVANLCDDMANENHCQIEAKEFLESYVFRGYYEPRRND